LSAPQTDDNEKRLTRRGFIKWTTALAVAGAAAVGLGAGYGSDLLLRPTTEKTVTQTSTTTVAPPVSLHTPPLSAVDQSKVDGYVKALNDPHAGETIGYWGQRTMGGDVSDIVQLRIKNGVITALEPDETVNAGLSREDANNDLITKVSIKARSYSRNYALRKTWYAPERILYPMKRTSARGNTDGQFVRTTWDDALTTVANAVKATTDKYGPYSIYYNPLANWYPNGTTSWGTASFESHTWAQQYAFGTGGPSEVTQIFNAKLIVMWGWTPSDCQGTFMSYYLTLAKEKGIPIIDIEPRYGIDSEIMADQWIPIRPTTDTALMLAIADVLIKQNLYNKDFVSKFVYGFDKWSAYVTGASDGVEKSPAWAEAITGVPAATTTALAQLIANSTPVYFVANWGPGRQNNGEYFAWASYALSAMTGNMGIAGTTVCLPSYRGGVTAATGFSVPSPSSNYGQAKATNTAAVTNHAAAFNKMILMRPQVDAGTLSQANYRMIIGQTSTGPVPNIHMMFARSRYSLQTLSDIPGQIQAMKQLDFIVAIASDIRNSTASSADVILPQAEDGPETDMGYRSITGGFMYLPKLIATQGESKQYEWILTQLAIKLGIGSSYMPKYTTDDQWDSMMQGFAQQAYQTWAATDAAKALNPPAWADFVKKPIIKVPVTSPRIAFSDQIQKAVKFSTPSGKIELYSDYLAQGTTFLQTTKYGGYLDPMPVYKDALMGFYDPVVKNYPIIVLSSHRRYHLHWQQQSNPMLQDEVYRHCLWLSVSDANARGINDGDKVLVSGPAGQCTVEAYVTSRMVPGCAVLWEATFPKFNQAGIDINGCVNTVQTQNRDNAGMFPYASPIEVQKL